MDGSGVTTRSRVVAPVCTEIAKFWTTLKSILPAAIPAEDSTDRWT